MESTLDTVEVRVLGVLVEKELSTPDYYPMTLNALKAGCNQKTNRHPVLSLSDGDVLRALESLQKKRLAGLSVSAHSRVDKYRHALAEAFGLDEAGRSALASLLLRGPETVGEVRARSSRMYAFESLEEAQALLDQLAEREEPLVSVLPRRPGQKEARYAHLLAGAPDEEEGAAMPSLTSAGRVDQLEAEVSALREELDALRSAFEDFRGQFE